MFRSRIFFKLTAAFLAVILLTAATVYLVAGARIETQVVRQTARLLEVRAGLLLDTVRPVFPGPAPADLEARIVDLGRTAETRFTLIDRGGKVLADSAEDPERMENHGQRPEILEAVRTGKPASAIRYSRTKKMRMLYLALPVYEDGALLGHVRAAVSLADVDERRAFLRANVLIGLATAAVLAILLGLFLSRRFTRPLEEMTRSAQAVAAGDYAQPLVTRRTDELGRLASALNSMSDQLRERLDALTRERNELRAILGSMLEGVVAVDRDERIVHLNDIAGSFLGVSPERCAGQRLWEITRIEEVTQTVRAVLDDGAEHTCEIRVARAHRERNFELRASPMKGVDGKIAGAVLVLHDVTELRRLETVRRDFVANVSHELKTPLTAIRGFVETLLDDDTVDAATRTRFLERVRAQVQRLSALVADLLVLSRVEAESGALERRPIDFRAPLAESVRRVRADRAAGRVTFSASLPEQGVHVLGDEEALRQVADNLLDNALKYTPDEGRVDLRMKAEGGYAVLEVEDTGIGIEAKDIGRIFERFYRVDKARSRELGGTGLGLSIVKHIVEAHSGKVSVTSAPGRGSTFRVEIPLRP